jgi:hypothetical protein
MLCAWSSVSANSPRNLHGTVRPEVGFELLLALRFLAHVRAPLLSRLGDAEDASRL